MFWLWTCGCLGCTVALGHALNTAAAAAESALRRKVRTIFLFMDFPRWCFWKQIGLFGLCIRWFFNPRPDAADCFTCAGIDARNSCLAEWELCLHGFRLPLNAECAGRRDICYRIPVFPVQKSLYETFAKPRI